MSEATCHISSPVKQSATVNICHHEWLTAFPVSQALSAYCFKAIYNCSFIASVEKQQQALTV